MLNVKKSYLQGPLILTWDLFRDERGFFQEIFNRKAFKAVGVPEDFLQVNHSFSRKGVVRGLHYQIRPYDQGKLVTVVSGRIYDVAVDVRRGSPTWGKWDATELVPGRAFWIPSGFAHGFQALEDSNVVYLVTGPYSREHERGVRWDDPELGISWPLRENVVVSEKDSSLPPLSRADTNFGVQQ